MLELGLKRSISTNDCMTVDVYSWVDTINIVLNIVVLLLLLQYSANLAMYFFDFRALLLFLLWLVSK